MSTSKAWAGLNINVPPKARALFNVALESAVGDGESTFFWSDRWLDGKTVAELAPSLIKVVSKRAVKGRTVAQGLLNRTWVSDITGALTVQLLLEYLLIWDMVDGLVLQPNVPDQHRWKLTQNGCYSSKSAYAAFFEGSTKFGPWRRIRKSWAPLRWKFFMWLAKKKTGVGQLIVSPSGVFLIRRPVPCVIRMRKHFNMS